MKALIRKCCFSIFLGMILVSCEHDPIIKEIDDMANGPDTTGNNPPDPSGKPCSPDTVYFVNDIEPLLKSNCAYKGCHGDGSAEDGVELSTYNSIIRTGDVEAFRPGESDLYEVLVEKDRDEAMPPLPNNLLSQEQIDKIYTWIAQGALYNACDGCDTTDVTFSLDIQPLIQNSCEGCHSGGNPSGGVGLTNYNQIQTLALNGDLYGVVNHNSGYVPMPYNQSKLSQCRIDQIKIWIDQGAPNN